MTDSGRGRRTEHEDTLCIFCAKACNSGCTWSAFSQPVDGWTAETNSRGILVRKCPEFVADDEHRNRPKSFDYDAVMRLLESVVRNIRDDYIWGRGDYKTKAENRMEIERFLKSKRGTKLLQLTDPDEVIRQLRALARRHDTEMVRGLL